MLHVTKSWRRRRLPASVSAGDPSRERTAETSSSISEMRRRAKSRSLLFPLVFETCRHIQPRMQKTYRPCKMPCADRSCCLQGEYIDQLDAVSTRGDKPSKSVSCKCIVSCTKLSATRRMEFRSRGAGAETKTENGIAGSLKLTS